jgi:hypothetical protein
MFVSKNETRGVERETPSNDGKIYSTRKIALTTRIKTYDIELGANHDGKC